MGIIKDVTQYIETRILTRQWKKQQRKWQEDVTPPKNTEFCPLLYTNCNKTHNHDTNCFLTKAPGCQAYIDHIKLLIQNKNPNTHVTKECALEYIARHS